MNVLSLFSGIGGIDLGLQRAGMTIAGQVEIDPWCRRVLAKHWPEVPRHDDVRTAAEWWLRLVADTNRQQLRVRPGSMDATPGAREGEAPKRQRVRADAGDGCASGSDAGAPAAGRPAVDLVAGGFPCQPVSLAGKGLAQADSRWLWPATRDVIRDLRPRWVLLENVPGLLGRGMGDVLGDLAACGYDAEWDCVPASAVGAPHRRDRVWIIAYPASHRRAPGDDRPAAPDGRRASLADTVGTGPQGSRPAESRRWPQPPVSDWWSTEPDVGRVAHGIPNRVDRLRGLGNAVVPQVVEHIGRLIMEAAA